ncbi:MAG TPA: efflux RND transporter periplasmic adaptor subunit, partial [Patescibacteria group bacterium]|nr:efflux RND transporter periplasmic adaptor subunit [Patescibacteria group bacterium]
WTVNIPNTMSSSYAGNMNSYQNALLSQQSAIASAQNQIASAQNKLQQDQINLEVKQEPPTDQQVESAKASLLAAQAQLQNAQLAYSNNMMTSPFDGTVAALNNQTGDQVTASTEIATVVTNHSLAVIPLNEVDVSKVKVGDKATMTFDAVDGLTITGEVAEVDNIGTVSQGVVNYNVKLSFDTEDDRVKPGMSVNASIITDIQADVLAVPNAAIKTAGTRTYVEELDASSTESAATGSGVISKTAPAQVTVTTGASDDNYTQILSGLNESDSIVVQTINSSTAKSAASSATSATNLLRGVTGGGGGGAVRFNSGGGASRTVGGGG